MTRALLLSVRGTKANGPDHATARHVFRAGFRCVGESGTAAPVPRIRSSIDHPSNACRAVGAHTLATPAPTLQLVERMSILLVDPEPERYLPSLRGRFEVSSVGSEEQAIRALRTSQPALVVIELVLPDGDGVSVCRQSKVWGGDPPSVLATTSVPERVPEALMAGCDGVLLKPFAPNLLFTRIGRLLRLRSKALTERAMWQRVRAVHRVEPPEQAASGTNIVWPNRDCPSCGHRGVVSFDAASYRRMWYACLSCRKVWLGPASPHGSIS